MHIMYCPYRSQASCKTRKLSVTQMSSEQDANEKQVEKSKPSSSPHKPETISHKANVSKQGEKIKKDLDKIMDEIDDVLEENAEEFIKSYVQRGGE